MSSIETWEAGPGSYNISQDLTTRSQVYQNPPRPIINKGRKNPSVFISNAQSKEWQGINSPPLSKYSPNTTLLHKSASAPKFGNEKRRDYFLIGSDRSPGPIYSFPELTTRTCSFGKGIKSKHFLLDGPSPCTYNPQTVEKKIPVQIKGYLSEKLYSKNYEKYYRGQIGPGPASYSISDESHKGIMLPKAKRMQEGNRNIAKLDTPGPGAYVDTFPIPIRRAVAFGNSKRNLDIRSCMFYIDGNSYELYK